MGDVVTEKCSSTPTATRLLLVEDNHELCTLLVRLLSASCYEVEVAADGEHGLYLAMTRPFDVVVLDRLLPDVDGLDLLFSLRRRGMVTPTLMLSALGEPADRVAGLNAGAEDYLPKPFDTDELLARLRALRRRPVDVARYLRVPGGALDIDTRQVVLGGRSTVRLSARECALLVILAGRPRKIFSREELRLAVFADAGADIVDTYVHYLRRKLGRAVVDTIRGYGYQLGSLR